MLHSSDIKELSEITAAEQLVTSPLVVKFRYMRCIASCMVYVWCVCVYVVCMYVWCVCVCVCLHYGMFYTCVLYMCWVLNYIVQVADCLFRSCHVCTFIH